MLASKPNTSYNRMLYGTIPVPKIRYVQYRTSMGMDVSRVRGVHDLVAGSDSYVPWGGFNSVFVSRWGDGRYSNRKFLDNSPLSRVAPLIGSITLRSGSGITRPSNDTVVSYILVPEHEYSYYKTKYPVID